MKIVFIDIFQAKDNFLEIPVVTAAPEGTMPSIAIAAARNQSYRANIIFSRQYFNETTCLYYRFYTPISRATTRLWELIANCGNSLENSFLQTTGVDAYSVDIIVQLQACRHAPLPQID